MPVRYCDLSEEEEAQLPSTVPLPDYIAYLRHSVGDEKQRSTKTTGNGESSTSCAGARAGHLQGEGEEDEASSKGEGEEDEASKVKLEAGFKQPASVDEAARLLSAQGVDGCEGSCDRLFRTDTSPPLRTDLSIYLKDWHCVLQCPTLHLYTTPHLFTPDWLNDYCLKRKKGREDEYRFVYLGPRNSSTLLHTDVLGSYSWSVNVAGEKHWTFFPPDQREHLVDANGHLLRDITHVDGERFPSFHLARRAEVIQRTGETLFVPSGWFHQVRNLRTTLSINHNWANACNIDFLFSTVLEDLVVAEAEIADCQEMEGWGEQCQLLLRANSGFDLDELFHLLSLAARGERREAEKNARSKNTLALAEAVFSLARISNVLPLLEAASRSRGRANEAQSVSFLAHDVQLVWQKYTTLLPTESDEERDTKEQ